MTRREQVELGQLTAIHAVVEAVPGEGFSEWFEFAVDVTRAYAATVRQQHLRLVGCDSGLPDSVSQTSRGFDIEVKP